MNDKKVIRWDLNQGNGCKSDKCYSEMSEFPEGDFVAAWEYDAVALALRESQAENAKLREALESCAGVIDTDFIKSETEDGEVEYWINDQTIQHIVEEALKETKP